jgi:hypothetical protein
LREIATADFLAGARLDFVHGLCGDAAGVPVDSPGSEQDISVEMDSTAPSLRLTVTTVND